ncbi:hypothetical protein C8R44DRAFT_929470 [Mycena epipterygia]|nr:hypothetical protein C8R44DRAFT_929470 [Mycena epipterygia]
MNDFGTFASGVAGVPTPYSARTKTRDSGTFDTHTRGHLQFPIHTFGCGFSVGPPSAACCPSPSQAYGFCRCPRRDSAPPVLAELSVRNSRPTIETLRIDLALRTNLLPLRSASCRSFPNRTLLRMSDPVSGQWQHHVIIIELEMALPEYARIIADLPQSSAKTTVRRADPFRHRVAWLLGPSADGRAAAGRDTDYGRDTVTGVHPPKAPPSHTSTESGTSLRKFQEFIQASSTSLVNARLRAEFAEAKPDADTNSSRSSKMDIPSRAGTWPINHVSEFAPGRTLHSQSNFDWLRIFLGSVRNSNLSAISSTPTEIYSYIRDQFSSSSSQIVSQARIGGGFYRRYISVLAD